MTCEQSSGAPMVSLVFPDTGHQGRHPGCDGKRDHADSVIIDPHRVPVLDHVGTRPWDCWSGQSSFTRTAVSIPVACATYGSVCRAERQKDTADHQHDPADSHHECEDGARSPISRMIIPRTITCAALSWPPRRIVEPRDIPAGQIIATARLSSAVSISAVAIFLAGSTKVPG